MPEVQLTSGFSWFSTHPYCLNQFELDFLQLKAFLLANSDWMTISDVTLGLSFHIISGLIGEVSEQSEMKSRRKVHSHYS